MARDEYWSVGRLAAALGVPSAVVRAWIGEGLLRAYRLRGGRWSIPAAEAARVRRALGLPESSPAR